MTKPSPDWRDEALTRLRKLRAKLAARFAIKRDSRIDRDHLAQKVAHCKRDVEAALRMPVYRAANGELDSAEREQAIERADKALANAQRAVVDFDAALDASLPELDEQLLRAVESAASALGIGDIGSRSVNAIRGA